MLWRAASENIVKRAASVSVGANYHVTDRTTLHANASYTSALSTGAADINNVNLFLGLSSTF